MQHILSLFLLLLLPFISLAEDNEHYDAQAIPLVQLEQQLIALYQPTALIDTQQQWLDNQQQLADSWLSAPPRLIGELKNDQFGKDLGYQNMTVGITLPLWWPSERPLAQQSAKQLAQWQMMQLAAQRQQLRLTLYRVSEDYVAARETLHHARLAVEHAYNLLTHVTAKQQAGDLAQFDLVSAHADWQQRQQDRLMAEQTLIEKRLAFAQVTGQETLPNIPEKTVNFATVFNMDACATLLSKQAATEWISAQLTQAEQASGTKPELTLASEQDRSDRLSASNQLARLSISIPLGATVHRQQASSQLAYELSQARIDQATAQREISTQWTQLQTRFHQSAIQWQQQQQLNQTLNQQYTMAQAAFRAGELDLRELLRIKSSWLEGQHTAELLKYGQVFSALSLSALQEDTGQ